MKPALRTPQLSESGMAFLKCAFAAPDFAVDPGKGIPDQFHGRTLSIKDCFTTAMAFTPGTDTYIIVAPVPGYAYFEAATPINGTTALTYVGTTFPTFAQNFGDGNAAPITFSQFRYASLAVGLYPTSNFMQFSGSIQVWRVDLALIRSLQDLAGVNDTDTVQLGVSGLQGVTTLAPRDNYSESFIKGAYTYAFDKTQDFEWQQFASANRYASAPGAAGTSVPRLQQAPGSRLTGLGNTNSIVIKVTTPVGATNTALLRVWNCIELQPHTNSTLYQFSGVSPPHDPVALELYSQLKMRFPVAVPCAENSKFWQNVLKVMQTLTAAGSYLPGPLGIFSKGLHMATTAFGAY